MSKSDDIINSIQKKRRFNAKVSKIISNALHVNECDFNSETIIKKINHTDELDILDIIIEIESVFNIEIPDENFSKFIRVGDLYDSVKNVTGKNRSLN